VVGDLLARRAYGGDRRNSLSGLNYKPGIQGRVDKLRFIFPRGKELDIPDEEVSTAIELNHSRDQDPASRSLFRSNLGGMSFGSVSIVTMLARVRGCGSA